jgi:hypothetical protein
MPPHPGTNVVSREFLQHHNVAAIKWFVATFMNDEAIQWIDLRLVLFLRLHKMGELNCRPMFAPGSRRVHAAACMPLD